MTEEKDVTEKKWSEMTKDEKIGAVAGYSIAGFLMFGIPFLFIYFDSWEVFDGFLTFVDDAIDIGKWIFILVIFPIILIVYAVMKVMGKIK